MHCGDFGLIGGMCCPAEMDVNTRSEKVTNRTIFLRLADNGYAKEKE